jgi:type VI secretion system protein ImpA
MRLPASGQPVDEYIHQHFGVPLEKLIAPVGDNDVGESVRHNGVYFNIKNARRSDDPTLPVGVWSHDLKTADWFEVQKLALEALSNKSKDMQLGVWLFESSIHLNGFEGIAPAAVLLKELCDKYWESMHPQMLDGDLEYRTNPINWINKKLTPQLRLLKITDTQLDGDEFCWDDWENALRYAQLKLKNQLNVEWDGPTPRAFKLRLSATRPESLIILHHQLNDGLTALGDLQKVLDERCGEGSPSLLDLKSLLSGISDMAGNELQRRGVRMSPAEDPAEGASVPESEGLSTSGGGSGGPVGKLKDRADAFVMLRQAAEFLMEDDPHSPVPYLVYTACDWGEKSAPDLYQELFLKLRGQLNIFELMGLEVENK